MRLRRKKGRWGKAALLGFIAVLAAGGILWSQGKRLQVTAEKVNVYLDPDERSPIIETLARGNLLTLASAVKSRVSWYYVYFVSPETGRTRSGYIAESLVRKLFPELRITTISSEDEILNPREINPAAEYRAVMKWGLGKGRVIDLEGRPLDQDRTGNLETIRYKRDVMDKRCLVEYVFDSDKLVTTRYHLLENYADKNRYIEDYTKLKSFLSQKYGQPRSDRIVWQDPSYKDKSSGWGIALSLGHLEFHSQWVFTETEVLITLAGGDSHVAFGAECNGLKGKLSASF